MKHWSKIHLPQSMDDDGNDPTNAAPECTFPNEIPDDDTPCAWCAEAENRIDGYCSEHCKDCAAARADGFEEGQEAVRYECGNRLHYLIALAPLNSELRSALSLLAHAWAPVETGE